MAKLKSTLRIDMEENLIIMNKTFAKKAQNTLSDEYHHLQKIRADYPEYRVVTREIKKAPHKESYKGLTYDYMERYILYRGTAEEVAENFAEYKEIRFQTECHSKGRRYPIMKQWFLNKYPEIVSVGILDAIEYVEDEYCDNVA